MRFGEAWRSELRATLCSVWSDALAATAPGPLVREALARLPEALARRPRYVMAIGKAAYSMLEGAVDAGGWVDAIAVGPADQRARFLREWESGREGSACEVGCEGSQQAVAGPAAQTLHEEVQARTRGGPLLARVGAHPVPDVSSVDSAERLQALVASVPAEAVLLALVSGGASAMVAKPRAGLTLAEKVAATSRRMAEGAAIAELNALRKALSAVKGGQLIEGVAAPVLSLVLSDVEGNDPHVVASGLTLSQQANPLELPAGRGLGRGMSGGRTRWNDYGSKTDATVRKEESKNAAEELLAGSVSEIRTMEAGTGRAADTLAHRDAVYERNGAGEGAASRTEAKGTELASAGARGRSMVREGDRYVILAGQDAVARAAVAGLRAKGWPVTFREEAVVGTVEEAARILMATGTGSEGHPPPGRSEGHPPPGRRAIVAYGEPVVAIPEDAGVGGRAQQLALILARELAGVPVVALVAGTDGVDGPSSPPVAGAIVDGGTWAAVHDAGIVGADALSRCDAGTALDAVGQLLVTGPTGVNHSDVMILLWDPAAGRSSS